MVTLKTLTNALLRGDLTRATDLVRLGVAIENERVWCLQFLILLVENDDADIFEWLFGFLDDKGYFAELVLTRAVFRERWKLAQRVHDLSPETVVSSDYLSITSESGRLDIEKVLFNIPSEQDWLFEKILPVYLSATHTGPMTLIHRLPYERRIFAAKILS